MFGYRHCIPGMNGRHLGPILGFFSASNQTNNDASGRCRHTKAFWFIFYLDILLFLTFFGSCFLLFFPISVSTADIWCFGVLAQKWRAHKWSPYISLVRFLFSLLPPITHSTFCNDMRYSCVSMYSYCWYIDEWLDGRTSFIPRGVDHVLLVMRPKMPRPGWAKLLW